MYISISFMEFTHFPPLPIVSCLGVKSEMGAVLNVIQMKTSSSNTKISHLSHHQALYHCSRLQSGQSQSLSSIPAALTPSWLEIRLKSTEDSHLKSKGSLHTMHTTSVLIYHDVSFETYRRERDLDLDDSERNLFRGILKMGKTRLY